MVEQNRGHFNGDESGEQVGKVDLFTPETQSALEQQGKKIYTLTGKTILQLTNEGVPISTGWEGGGEAIFGEINSLHSRRSQVAIENIERMPVNQTLLRSFDKSVPEQLEMIEQKSGQLQQVVPGARIIMGNPADYLELAWEIQKTTGRDLFTSEHYIPLLSRLLKKKFGQHWYARTDTHLDSMRGRFAFAVTFYRKEFHITAWPRQEGNHIMGAFPLIVPSDQKSI